VSQLLITLLITLTSYSSSAAVCSFTMECFYICSSCSKPSLFPVVLLFLTAGAAMCCYWAGTCISLHPSCAMPGAELPSGTYDAGTTLARSQLSNVGPYRLGSKFSRKNYPRGGTTITLLIELHTGSRTTRTILDTD
jgi:hypothetical protein